MKNRDLTTGEVGRICDVSVKTVRKWTSTGTLASYFVPGSKHRRITRRALVEFSEQNKIPVKPFSEIERNVAL